MLVGWVKDRRVDLPAHSLSRMFTVLAVELVAYGARKTLKSLRRIEWKTTEQKRAMLEQSGLDRKRGSPGPVCQVDSVYEWSENQRRLASCIQETCSDQFALRHADRFRLKIFKALRDVYSTLLLHSATSLSFFDFNRPCPKRTTRPGLPGRQRACDFFRNLSVRTASRPQA